MPKTEWWSTMSDVDGKTYYFKRDSHGKVHRVSQDVYKSHLKQDVPEFEEDGKTPSGPRYWTVGTTGKNGENDFIVMRKFSGDSNVYTLDPNDIHGDLAHDAAAMNRIGSIINKHKATLRAADPNAEIPIEVTYNLNSALALRPNTSHVMSIPTISADSINTAATFNSPYAKMLVTSLRQITIPTLSTDRYDCMDEADAESTAKAFDGSARTYHATMGNVSQFVLKFETYNINSYNNTEMILKDNIMKHLYPELRDHWKCPDKSLSYWLYNFEGLCKITKDNMDDTIIKNKIVKNARELVNRASSCRLYLGRTGKDNDIFTTDDFLMKTSDNSLVFWNDCTIAYFPNHNKAMLVNAGIALQPKDGTIPGSFLDAISYNAKAIAADIVFKESARAAPVA